MGVTEYVESLRRPLPRMTNRAKLLFVALGLGIAATRPLAIALTPVDWDETLFTWGVSEYDVAVHHPHPPGYPLFILAAKLLRFLVHSDFRAVQAVAVIASMLVFPAVFLLARELRLGDAEAFAAATIAPFMPTIWYYGGGALSDVPALVLVLFASALLLRGGRSPRAYIAGALVTAAAMSTRPHLLLIAAIPALLGALALRSWRTFAIAWSVAAVGVIAAYLGAAYFSDDFPRGYLKEVAYIRGHVSNSDSFLNPARPPLRTIAARALVFPYGGGRARFAILAFAVIALARRKAWIVVAMFLPIAILTWLMLDLSALPRYAVSYAPLYALLAAIGIGVLTRSQRWALGIVTLLVTVALAKWTLPALRIVRTQASPPAAAMTWIREHVPTVGPRVYVDNELIYLADYFLRDYDFQLVFDENKLRDADFAPGNVYVVEGNSDAPDARVYTRKRERLWVIGRPRYFEIAVIPMHRMVRYVDGWYPLETAGDVTWRWMTRRSITRFPPMRSGRGSLKLHIYLPRPTTLSVTWNGAVIERVQRPEGELELRYDLCLAHRGRERAASRSRRVGKRARRSARARRDGEGDQLEVVRRSPCCTLTRVPRRRRHRSLRSDAFDAAFAHGDRAGRRQAHA